MVLSDQGVKTTTGVKTYIYIVLGLIEVLYVERNTVASTDNFLHQEVLVALNCRLFAPTLPDIFIQAKEGFCNFHLFQVLQGEVPPSVTLDGSCT